MQHTYQNDEKARHMIMDHYENKITKVHLGKQYDLYAWIISEAGISLDNVMRKAEARCIANDPKDGKRVHITLLKFISVVYPEICEKVERETAEEPEQIQEPVTELNAVESAPLSGPERARQFLAERSAARRETEQVPEDSIPAYNTNQAIYGTPEKVYIAPRRVYPLDGSEPEQEQETIRESIMRSIWEPNPKNIQRGYDDGAKAAEVYADPKGHIDVPLARMLERIQIMLEHSLYTSDKQYADGYRRGFLDLLRASQTKWEQVNPEYRYQIKRLFPDALPDTVMDWKADRQKVSGEILHCLQCSAIRTCDRHAIDVVSLLRRAAALAEKNPPLTN